MPNPTFMAVVPARAASTRLPNKMMADILGKPLFAHTVARAQESLASQVYLATDDATIFKTAQSLGIQVLLTRADHPSGTDRLAEVVQQLHLDDQAIVVNVQGDEPLIDPSLINQVAQALEQHPQEAAIATAAYPITDPQKFHNPNVVKVVCDAQGQALYFSRAPIPWARNAFAQQPPQWPNGMPALHHIGLYAYRAQFLRQFPTLTQGVLEQLESLEQLRALEHGYKIHVVTCEKAPAPGVDTEQDLALVRQLMAQQQVPLSPLH